MVLSSNLIHSGCSSHWSAVLVVHGRCLLSNVALSTRVTSVFAFLLEAVKLFKWLDRYTCDGKKSSQIFIAQNAAAEHHYGDLISLANSFPNGNYCSVHKCHCIPPAAASRAHVLVASPPCSPFSRQRVGRHLPGRHLCIAFCQLCSCVLYGPTPANVPQTKHL